MSSQSSLAELLDWCSQNGIVIDHRLRLCYDENKGVHVISGNSSIPSNTTLVRIPKGVVLSVKSCSFSRYVPFELHGLEAQLGLSFALYMEILKGKSSRWYGYLQSLTAVDLPIFWDHDPPPPQPVVRFSHDPGAWLHGTEAIKLLLRPQDQLMLSEHITEYYQRVVVPTIERYDLRCFLIHEPSLGAFREAFSLVSSRAFMLDVYHGLSMTPIADAFNHVQDNQVHLESDFYVCPECGSLRECTHDRDHIGPETLVDADDDHSGHEFWYEMVSNADIQPHEEVFNTYGEDLTNSQLFVQYGFILDPNDNDTLNFNLDEVLFALKPLDGTWQPPSFELEVHNASATSFRHSRLVFEDEPINSGTAFRINSDGRISCSLWIFLVKCTCQKLFLTDFPKGIEEKDLDDMVTTQLNVESALEEDGLKNDKTSTFSQFVSRKRCANVLSKVTEIVIRLCATRAEAIGVSGTADEDLGAFLDVIPESMTRLRLALSIVINERSILDSCKFNWIDFLELLEANEVLK